MVNILKDVLSSGNISCEFFSELLDKIDISRYGSTSKNFKQIADWDPKISLNEGIVRTVDYIKKNLDNYL